MAEPIRRHGKPFDYFRLGRSARRDFAFLDAMRERAERLRREMDRPGGSLEVTACPICACSTREEAALRHGVPFARCGRCAHLFAARVPSARARAALHQESDTANRAAYADARLALVRLEAVMGPKRDFVMEALGKESPGSWLDVGCGNGDLLYLLRQSGWKVAGVDPNAECAAAARAGFGIEVALAEAADYAASTDERFDVVSWMGSLVCVERPVADLQATAALLEPTGAMVLELNRAEALETEIVRAHPDLPSRSAAFYGATTPHIFSEVSIDRMLSSANLERRASWYYGTDVYEALNHLWQISAHAAGLARDRVFDALEGAAMALQEGLDRAERSSHVLIVAGRVASGGSRPQS